MSEPKTPRRLMVVDGGRRDGEPITDTTIITRPSGETITSRTHSCSACSQRIGYTPPLIEARFDAIERNGNLEGGTLYWACGGCFKPYYLIGRCD